jgi:hypothetical protein
MEMHGEGSATEELRGMEMHGGFHGLLAIVRTPNIEHRFSKCCAQDNATYHLSLITYHSSLLTPH